MSESVVSAKMKHPRWQPNQIYRELMGVLSLSSFDGFNSASRKQMFSSHIGQALVINGSTIRRIQTGMEREYGKYTFAPKFPVDAEVIRVIERYPRTIDADRIKHNPETLVIYEDHKTRRVGCISLVDFYSNHPYFGFAYKNTDAAKQVRAGALFAEDTILQNSPSITANGDYMYGRECNVVFMSHPAVAEDGILISRDVLSKFGFKIYDRRTIEWGSKQYPVNCYGDQDNYKPFPDIGDYVRDDGVLGALRTEDPDYGPVEQSINATLEFDNCFNHLVYSGRRGGKVIDIKVMHDPESRVPTTLIGMDVQMQRYDKARRAYYQAIVNEYEALRRHRKEKLALTKDFHRLVVEAISVVGTTRQLKQAGKGADEPVSKLYRGIPLDDWRVEFVIEHDVIPTIGFKLTDTHGGKGVICHIAEPHEMPVDAAGNRADIIMAPDARMARMNLGGLYEPYINAVSRDFMVEVKEALGLDPKVTGVVNYDMPAIKRHPNFPAVEARIKRFYEIISPRTHNWLTNGDYGKPFEQHLHELLKDGFYHYIPPDNEPEGPQIVRDLQREFKSVYGPVTYIGNSGLRRTTKRPHRIGSMYIIILDKIGDDRTAVSSSKLQNFGVLAPITSRDKNSSPIRRQAIRAFGETEERIIAANVDDETMAELGDRNNNILTHRIILDALYNAPRPTNVVNLVNRDENPLGNARPLQLVKHQAFCGGWKFVYEPYQPNVSSNLAEIEE